MPLPTLTPLRLSLASLAVVGLGLSPAAASTSAKDPTNSRPYYHRTHHGGYTRAAYRHEPAAQQDLSGNVVIRARRIDHAPSFTSPFKRMTASRLVSYRDLDINSRGGASVLHGRIMRAARDDCNELDALYPIGDPEVGDCVSEAVRDAEHQIPRSDLDQGRY